MKLFVLGLAVALSSLCSAEIPVYKSTDNTGINKLERIGVIEQYLINLSGTLQTIEAKVDASALKINSLEKVVAQIKDTDIKNIEKKLGEKSTAKTPEMEELTKLQADFTTLKNEDIESIRVQLQRLNSSVQLLQSQVK